MSEPSPNGSPVDPRVLRVGSVVVAIASALVWAVLPALGWPARMFTTFLLVPLPALMLLQLRLVERLPAEEDREAVYLSSALTVWALAGLAMMAARFSDFERAQIWLSWPGLGSFLVVTAGVTAAGLLLMVLGRLLKVPETPLIRFLLPRTGSERIAFAGLSVSAGIAEELVFRAFLIAALLQAGASLAVAVAVSVLIFAVSHAYQGFAGVIRVALLGGLLTVPILLVESVYPAMAAHALLDLLAGLVMADWLAGDHDH